MPACLIPKILSNCLASIQDPKPSERFNAKAENKFRELTHS